MIVTAPGIGRGIATVATGTGIATATEIGRRIARVTAGPIGAARHRGTVGIATDGTATVGIEIVTGADGAAVAIAPTTGMASAGTGVRASA